MYPSTYFQRIHVLPVHVFISSPTLHIDMQFTSYVIIKLIAIIGFQTYSKDIPPRSYVHPVHPFEEPCTPSTYFHHLTCITYKHAIYMRCHHKKIAIIGFQTYTKHIPPRSYVSKYILLRSHVHPVHPFKELCIPYTSFQEAMYSKGIL